MTEQQIRTRLAQDPAAGQAALFEQYFNYVYAIVHRKVCAFGSREDTEECVIDVFTEVIRNFDTIRSGSLKAYIASVAHNKALNTCRRLSARSRQSISIDSEEFGELTSPQDVARDAERREQARKLTKCIASLGEPDSAIIIQRYYLGRNASEIARTLGMKPVTVRSRLNRALKRLRTMLEEQGIG